MDFLTQLILERNNNHELLNKEDAERIARFVAINQGYELKDVITKDVCKEYPNFNGLYSFRDNTISYFDKRRLDYVYEATDDFRKTYNPDGSYHGTFNFFYLLCTTHEIAHLRQDHIRKSPNSFIEKKLIVPFLKFTIGSNLYDINHDSFPLEVNAENVAYITANNIYNRLPLNSITPEDKRLYQLITLKWLLFGNYMIDPQKEEVLCPYERIIDNFDGDILNKMNMTPSDYGNLIYDTEDLTLYKKLVLGLPISVKEYAYVNLLIDELANDMEINGIKKLQKRL